MFKLKPLFLAPILASALLVPQACAQVTPPVSTPTLTLDLSKPGVTVSPMLYGLMTEEINYSYDGGLYAELIRNRSFKDDAQNPVNWSAVGSAAIALDTTQPVNEALTTCLKLTSTGPGGGVANEGWWGIPVRPSTTYQASFYAKNAKIIDPFDTGVPLTLSIQSRDGATTYAQTTVRRVRNRWQKYTATLSTPAGIQPTAATRFVISSAEPSTLYLNLVSLFPPTFKNRPNGNRPDIMQLLADMKPKFLRFPGGNYLQGMSIASRFDWKKTLGPIDQRPGHMGTWNYRSSDGMGLLEFLTWCEDLNMEPVLDVYAGYSLRGPTVNGVVTPGERAEAGPALQVFVQEALDEIEYVIGDPVTTKWGARRAQDGHPAPFPLTYVEIGNEDGFDVSGSYDSRYTQFFDAIRAKYPQLKIISSVGGRDGLGARQKVTSRKLEIVDEHYYLNAGQSQIDARRYDSYDRNGPKVFVGEWATREGAPTTNMNAALGDAAFMTGMERNSDHVIMACYAPLFVNVNPGGMQWRSNLIGYDALSSYGSPSYHAQKMFNNYLGDNVVPIAEADIPTRTWQAPARGGRPAPEPRQIPALFSVATRAKSGTVFLKVVNAGATPQTTKIDLNGAGVIAPDATLVTLSSANPEDTNSIMEPNKIVPVTTKISGLGRSFRRTFAPYSINVLQIEAR